MCDCCILVLPHACVSGAGSCKVLCEGQQLAVFVWCADTWMVVAKPLVAQTGRCCKLKHVVTHQDAQKMHITKNQMKLKEDLSC